MSEDPHYTQYDGLVSSILGFAEYARSHGLNVGMNESMEAIHAAEKGLIEDKESFRYALKAIFCCSLDDVEVFDIIYKNFWGNKRVAIKSRMSHHVTSNVQRETTRSLVMLGTGEDESEEDDDNRNVSGANRLERLRKTDFSKVEEIDSQMLEALASRLWKQMSMRLKKKMKRSKKGEIDIRGTIRSNMSKGGNLLNLKFKDKKPMRNRLILILDVSGSMDKYSFFLLRFIYELNSYFKDIEVFLFSTKLVRITDIIKERNWSTSLALLSYQADHWSSGTKIGKCIQEFNEEYGKKVLNGRSVTIVLSDGLDTGEPELLARSEDPGEDGMGSLFSRRHFCGRGSEKHDDLSMSVLRGGTVRRRR